MALVNSRARRGALLLATLLVACLLPGQVTSSAAADVTSGKWRPTVPSTTTTTSDPCGTRLRKASGGYWSCTFAETFSGTSLDRTKWVPQETRISGYTTHGGECYVDSSNNYFVRDGRLNLVARREAEPFVCKSPVGDYTTQYTGASVSSWGKFAQTYGRFEFRAKFPALTGPGLHSALWLYPQEHTYGGWPYSGEIDVAEYFTSDPSRVYPTLHYAGSSSADTGWNCLMSSPSTFHSYVVEWTATQMRFLYDGQVCFSRSWAPDPASYAAPKPFDQPFLLVLTQALGGMWNAVRSETPLPGTMQVDHVKVWK